MQLSWKHKAALMRWCAAAPFGGHLYAIGQRLVGRLRVNPIGGLRAQAKMTAWLQADGITLEGAEVFELGTGHVPVMPLGFFLTGAAQTTTIDLHRRINHSMTKQSIDWIVTHESDVLDVYSRGPIGPAILQRLNQLKTDAALPANCLRRAGIRYLAPADARCTSLSSHSFDIYFSNAVLEHVEASSLESICAEARRLLRPGGRMIHFIDPSDHFSHQDPSILAINFLKWSDDRWGRIAGNEFAYCNRLRASEYRRLFDKCGFTVKHWETDVDDKSMRALSDFSLAHRFRQYEAEDLCTTGVRCLLERTPD